MVGAVGAQILGHKVTGERHPLLAANRVDWVLALQIGTDWNFVTAGFGPPPWMEKSPQAGVCIGTQVSGLQGSQPQVLQIRIWCAPPPSRATGCILSDFPEIGSLFMVCFRAENSRVYERRSITSTIIEHYCPVPLQCANGLEHM